MAPPDQSSRVSEFDRPEGFPAHLDRDTRILILGTMPGVASLRAEQYYAHPRNRFWRLMADFFGVPADAPYDERIDRLLAARVGLWDTLRACDRKGSLDSMIRNAEPNDFQSTLTLYPEIRVIALNGRKAEEIFRKRVMPGLSSAVADRLVLLALPSTSPANARGGYPALRQGWAILRPWMNGTP